MPEALPVPEIIERNSERTLMIVGFIVAVVVVIAQLVFLGITAAPIAVKLAWLAPVNIGLSWAAKIAWEYIRSRAPKHHAMAMRLLAELQKQAMSTGSVVPALPLPLPEVPAPGPSHPSSR